MTKSTARRSALDRQRSLLKAWQPGVAPLRELVAGGYMPASVKRAFTGLKLDPNSENDWRVLAALLADHLFDEGKKRGRKKKPWTTFQQIELLWKAHKLRERNPHLINSDDRTCGLLAKNGPAHFRSGQGKGTGLIKQLREARQKFKNISEAFPLAFGRN